MATAAQRLSRFVSVSFPGGSLPPPRFDGLPSLRFELGGASRPRDRLLPRSGRARRTEEAVARASALFEAALPAAHHGCLDAYWRAGELQTTDPEALLLHLLPEARRAYAEVAEAASFAAGDARMYVRLTAPLAFGDVDHAGLFRLLGRAELGVTPALVGTQVYLVDETDPLVFHVHDLRAAFAYAPSAHRLRGL
jgi:hypothetical protein